MYELVARQKNVINAKEVDLLVPNKYHLQSGIAKIIACTNLQECLLPTEETKQIILILVQC